MRWIERVRDLLGPFGRLLPGTEAEADLSTELRHHIELEAEDLVRQGWEPEAARREAFRRFGGEERTKERVREGRRGRWLADLGQDLRYAVRSLRRSPGFAFTTVGILAIAIAATTAVFSVFQAVLLSPLPYPQPDQVVQIWNLSPERDQRGISGANLAEWQDTRSFSAIGGYRTSGRTGTLTGEGDPAIVSLADVQPAFFRVLGVPPLLGRTLNEEDVRGDGRVAVLSHGIWDQRFGADSTVVGRTLELDGRQVQVAGVMSREFGLPDVDVDIWLPLLASNPGMDPTNRATWLLAVGRLRPDATLAAARTEMATIAARSAQDDPDLAGWDVSIRRLHEDLTSGARSLLTLLMVGAGVFLLAACGNLATLSLSRAVGRERELGVRSAIGAGRNRILRQLLTENVVLAGAGGIAAMVLTPYLLRTFLALAPDDVPLIERAAVDTRTFVAAAGLALFSCLVFGLLPAVRQSRFVSRLSLRGTVGGSRRNVRARAAILVTQVSLAVVLLVGAGLFVRTFAALQSVDVGFERGGLATMRVVLPMSRYPTAEQQTDFLRRLTERVSEIPGVRSASGSDYDPGFADGESSDFTVEGTAAATPTEGGGPTPLRRVAPEYFAVMGQRVIRGRGIAADDRADAPPVVVVNESFARRVWPEENAVGRRISRGDGEWEEVVGVVADARVTALDEEPVPRMYAAHAQRGVAWRTWWTLIARVEAGADMGSIQEGMRAALLDLDSDLPPRRLATVDDNYAVATGQRTFAMALAIAFSASALLLCLLGLYGLISFTVASRRREIGLRVAIGANRSSLVTAVVRRALVLAGIGTLLGIVVALGATRAIEGMLFGVTPADLPTYLGTVTVVLFVALAAAGIPALRAAKVDPMAVLTSD